ncbi:helix-turn-helix domain-containing protein [Streptomyces cyaneofuscatus]|uniref:helix-turn-helix domain-containing protein n=1 Tax=Streptomyces cyaneofuscatus TaxID=66883 RepID=UPI003816EEAC
MPPRRFNGPQLMRARRAVDVSRRELAAAVGAKSQAIVGDWEAERTFPAGEKLPAIARGVRADIDVLFPREGACDLADLRCDAGYAQFAAAEAVQISKYSLSRAERGARRLNEEWIAPLAALYGVDEDALLAAQRRSFGEEVPASTPAALPPLTETLRALVGHRFPDGAPSPDTIAAGVNSEAGAQVVRGDQIEALLRGIPVERVFGDARVARAVAITGMAGYFGVSVLHLDDDPESRVLDDLRYLASRYDVDLAARSGEGGVTPEMIGLLSGLLSPGRADLSET